MKHLQLFLAISLATSSLMLASCNKQKDGEAASQQQMPPAVVNVLPVQYESVPLVKTFAGRTVAYEVADVRPQVTGIINDILYREGSMVEKDQPLYKLSIENYESSQAANTAAVEQASANVNTAKADYNNALANRASMQAELEQAKSDVDRLEPLVGMKAISQQQFEQAVTKYKTAQAAYASSDAAVEQAKANIAGAEAAVNTAKAQLSGSQLDLSRTIVRAPIAGKTDRASVTVGALVNANQATPLVTISKLNPIYVDITQSSADLLKLKQQQANGSIQAGSSSVELILEDGSIYPGRGQLSLAEAKVDPDTGSVTLRAVFKNDNYILLPGMYVTARLTQGVINNAILLPQSALQRTPKGETQVYVVDQNNKIQARDVTVNGDYQGDWIITDGLKPGENVVIVGGSNVQPNQQVDVKPFMAESNTQGPIKAKSTDPSSKSLLSQPAKQTTNSPSKQLATKPQDDSQNQPTADAAN